MSAAGRRGTRVCACADGVSVVMSRLHNKYCQRICSFSVAMLVFNCIL